MKHFMCVHHWNNEETKQRVREMLNEQPMTDRQFLDFYNGEKAKELQHWGGEGDFFYCHWAAESEDDLQEAFEFFGVNNDCYTMVMEANRFATSFELKDEILPSFS